MLKIFFIMFSGTFLRKITELWEYGGALGWICIVILCLIPLYIGYLHFIRDRN